MESLRWTNDWPRRSSAGLKWLATSRVWMRMICVVIGGESPSSV
jgi:hypothetical protein